MQISRFQLKLTLIFLIVLLVPAVLATLLTMYILTEERTALDADKRTDKDKTSVVEAVLQEATEIAYDIIEEAEAECQSIAEEISSDEKVAAAFDSTEELEEIVSKIVPVGGHLSVTVFDFRTDIAKGTICFSTSTNTENVPYSIIDALKQDPAPYSHQSGSMVYGVAPVFRGDDLVGAAVVCQELKQELVNNIIDLQMLLSVYTLEEDVRRFLLAALVVLFAVLAVGGAILAAFLARNVTKPILSLVAGTREVARGNLDYKVEVKGKDEIAVLEDSFNSMVTQLKDSRERIIRAERLAAWRDVARRIAHEIKNPLTPIQLSMYRLRKNLGSDRYDDIFQQSYTSITNEVENLRNMVTEFSDFARMPKPRTRLVDPTEIVQNAISLYTELPDNITLHTELADNLPQVMADSDQMRQVLHNLMGNAVDAMSDSGQLSVKMQLEADDVVIQISDTGCGMSEEVRQKIFTPYFTTKETGTGLGMAITAQIIEEHGGEISIDSEEGVGTTVTVKLKAAMNGEAIAET